MHARVGSADDFPQRAAVAIGERGRQDASSPRAGEPRNGRVLRHGVVAPSPAAGSLGFAWAGAHRFGRVWQKSVRSPCCMPSPRFPSPQHFVSLPETGRQRDCHRQPLLRERNRPVPLPRSQRDEVAPGSIGTPLSFRRRRPGCAHLPHHLIETAPRSRSRTRQRSWSSISPRERVVERHHDGSRRPRVGRWLSTMRSSPLTGPREPGAVRSSSSAGTSRSPHCERASSGEARGGYALHLPMAASNCVRCAPPNRLPRAHGRPTTT